MNLIDDKNWSFLAGSWKAEESKLVQSDNAGGLIARAYLCIESNNFIASFKMKLLRINEEVHRSDNSNLVFTKSSIIPEFFLPIPKSS